MNSRDIIFFQLQELPVTDVTFRTRSGSGNPHMLYFPRFLSSFSDVDVDTIQRKRASIPKTERIDHERLLIPISSNIRSV
jgi:hypothetical protein